MPDSKQQLEQESIPYALPALPAKRSVLLRAPPAFYPVAIIAELALLAVATWSIFLLAFNVPESYNATLQPPSESQIALWSCLLLAIFVGNIFIILTFGRKDCVRYCFSISSVFYLLGGASIGCLVAIVQISAQIKVLESQSASAVAQAQQAYTNAAQYCAQMVSANRPAFTLEPCYACDFIPITYDDNIGLVTSLDTEDWEAEPIYWTQSIEIDQIVCESQISPIGVEIWPWFINNSIHLNESLAKDAWPCDPVKPNVRPSDWVPGHFTSWLDNGGMQPFLLAVYELAFGLYAPMTLNVSHLPTSDCVWLHGVASKRFGLTTICGKGNTPNPAQRSGLPSNFAACASPELLAWQAEYASELAALNQSIYNVPSLPAKLANFGNDVTGGAGPIFAAAGIIVGLVVGTAGIITGIVELYSKKQKEAQALLGNINN